MSNSVSTTTKKALRRQYISLRKEMEETEWVKRNQGILDQVLSLGIPVLQNPQPYVHIYLAISKNREPDTYNIAAALNEKNPGIQWVISKTDIENSRLYHFLWDAENLVEENDWGIPEPVGGIRVDEKQLDVIFVPLIVADYKGHRVGYGKGFYDRFLSQCRPDALKIGISLFDLVDEIEDPLSTDIPLDACITPYGTYWFNKSSET